MTPRAFRLWSFVHKWSSLIATVFMLMLCLTGLPLIFHHEIEHLTLPELETLPKDHTAVPVQSIIDRADRNRPDEHVLYAFFDDEDPLVMVATGASPMSLPETFHYQTFDLRNGRRLDVAQPTEGFMYVMRRLHVDLFAALPGMLFLGLMGLLVMVAIVSGVVLYAPFMRKQPFATVRTQRSRRLRWLDLHNLLGIVTVVWLAVVTLTGMINTLAVPIERLWQASELAAMSASHRDRPVPEHYAAADRVTGAVRAAFPDSHLLTLAFPGTPFASPHHGGTRPMGDGQYVLGRAGRRRHGGPVQMASGGGGRAPHRGFRSVRSSVPHPTGVLCQPTGVDGAGVSIVHLLHLRRRAQPGAPGSGSARAPDRPAVDSTTVMAIAAHRTPHRQCAHLQLSGGGDPALDSPRLPSVL